MAKKNRTQKPSQFERQSRFSAFALRLFPFLVIPLIGVMIYSNSFDCSFHFDDYEKIVNNRVVKNVSDLKSLWKYKHSRFIGFLSFALNYRFNGFEVFGYHVVNVSIHIITSILVWWLVLLTFSTPVMRKMPMIRHGELIALGSACIFLTHPLQTQSVTYIVQRLASLAALFYVASLCMYVKARLSTGKVNSLLFFTGAGITTVLGFLTKEITFTLPFALLLYEISFLYTGRVKDLLTVRKIGSIIIAVAVLAVIIYALFSFNKGEFFRSTPSQRDEDPLLTPLIYLMTQFKVIVKYVQLAIVPIGLTIDHDIPASLSFFEPKTIAGFLVLAALVSGALWLFPRRRLAAFGILWFFLTISVESSIKPLHNVIFEHRLYLPMVGLCLAAMAVLDELLNRIHRNAFMIALFVITAVFSIGTYQRNKVWKDDVSLWSDVLKKSPGKARAHFNLGLALSKAKNIEGAIAEYKEAIRTNPNHTNAHNNLGEVYVNLRRFDDAIREYREALRSDSLFYEAYNNIGNALLLQGKFEEALDAYKQALAITPWYKTAHNNMGRTLFFQGKLDEAIKEYTTALYYDPEYGTAHCNLGEALLRTGKYDEARGHIMEAIRINPDDQRARALLRDVSR